jgi:hypothetical protein
MYKLMMAAGAALCLLVLACQSKQTAQQETPAPAQTAISADTSAAKATESGYYTCTMDPQVHETKPGKCPICGMTLVFKKEGKDTTAK